MILSIPNLFAFFLILARLAGLFSVAPIFSDRGIPQTMKLAMIVWISLLLWFVVPVPKVVFISNVDVILALVFEFFLGFVIGFIPRIILLGVQMAGSMMDMQMGLSVAATFDPSTGGQTTIMERLMFYLALFAMFSTDAHHLFLVAILESFKVIPLVEAISYPGLLEQATHLAGGIFLTGLDLSMPVLIIIFMMDFSLGLLARLAPQVNVFSLGFQIKPILGLWIFLFTLPVLMTEFNGLLSQMMDQIYRLFSEVRVI
jgi:flagellar biosynthetic protein FliR